MGDDFGESVDMGSVIDMSTDSSNSDSFSDSSDVGSLMDDMPSENIEVLDFDMEGSGSDVDCVSTDEGTMEVNSLMDDAFESDSLDESGLDAEIEPSDVVGETEDLTSEPTFEVSELMDDSAIETLDETADTFDATDGAPESDLETLMDETEPAEDSVVFHEMDTEIPAESDEGDEDIESLMEQEESDSDDIIEGTEDVSGGVPEDQSDISSLMDDVEEPVEELDTESDLIETPEAIEDNPTDLPTEDTTETVEDVPTGLPTEDIPETIEDVPTDLPAEDAPETIEDVPTDLPMEDTPEAIEDAPTDLPMEGMPDVFETGEVPAATDFDGTTGSEHISQQELSDFIENCTDKDTLQDLRDRLTSGELQIDTDETSGEMPEDLDSGPRLVLTRDQAELWESGNNAINDTIEAIRDDLRDKGFKDGPEMEAIVMTERIRMLEEFARNIQGDFSQPYQKPDFSEIISEHQGVGTPDDLVNGQDVSQAQMEGLPETPDVSGGVDHDIEEQNPSAVSDDPVEQQREYDDFEETVLDEDPDFYESGAYYTQGINEYGFEGTCGPTSQANALNKLFDTNEFTENKVLDVAVDNDLCTVDGSPESCGGTSTEQFMELYDKMNEQLDGKINTELHEYGDALDVETVAEKLDEGCVLNVAVDAAALWDQPREYVDAMGTPCDDFYSDHWITVTGVQRDELGNVTGFDIIDSGGGESFVDADKYHEICFGTDEHKVIDPTTIVVSKNEKP